MNANVPLQSKQQIATWAGVSVRTVQSWAADGCPHIRLGRVLRFQTADVLTWLQAKDERMPKPRGLRQVGA